MVPIVIPRHDEKMTKSKALAGQLSAPPPTAARVALDPSGRRSLQRAGPRRSGQIHPAIHRCWRGQTGHGRTALCCGRLGGWGRAAPDRTGPGSRPSLSACVGPTRRPPGAACKCFCFSRSGARCCSRAGCDVPRWCEPTWHDSGLSPALDRLAFILHGESAPKLQSVRLSRGFDRQ